MLIVCPTCISAYRRPADADARALRCAQCGVVFEATPLAPPALDMREPAVLSLHPPDVLPGLRPFRHPLPPAGARTSRAPARVVLPLIVAALGLGMTGLACRAPITRLLPGTAPLFAALGLPVPSLGLGPIETALADEGPTRVLTLAGKITNALSTEAEVPNLRIVVRDDTATGIYSWVAPPPQARLGPGESVDFRSRLVSPPANGHDLVVSFADAADGGAKAEVKTGR